jgi:hypothetical protein
MDEIARRATASGDMISDKGPSETAFLSQPGPDRSIIGVSTRPGQNAVTPVTSALFPRIVSMAWLFICGQIVDTALSHPSSDRFYRWRQYRPLATCPRPLLAISPSLRQEKGNSIFLQYAPQKHQKWEKQARQPPTLRITKSRG